MKTKEWLASHLENGDVLTAEVLLELLDSYIHKSEFGQVADGDARPVSGEAVKKALDVILQTLQQNMQQMIAEALPGLLQTELANYVTTEALNTDLQNRATQTCATTAVGQRKLPPSSWVLCAFFAPSFIPLETSILQKPTQKAQLTENQP